MGDLNKFTKKRKKGSPAPSKTVKLVEKKKLGRKADWEDIETVRTSLTLPLETYQAIQLALATTHQGTKTQNRLINAAILAFLGKDE
jgi:hypothetical protein